MHHEEKKLIALESKSYLFRNGHDPVTRFVQLLFIKLIQNAGTFKNNDAHALSQDDKEQLHSAGEVR